MLAARVAGELIPAGEGSTVAFDRPTTSFSVLTRADVKATTIRARDSGELIPAGDADEATLAHERAQTQYARMTWLNRHPSLVATGRE